jgi:hypothetical protein
LLKAAVPVLVTLREREAAVPPTAEAGFPRLVVNTMEEFTVMAAADAFQLQSCQEELKTPTSTV